jgi:hypothetical protein
MEKTKVNGYIKSIASDTTIDKHPLQTRVSLILTDFNPNQNKQGVPATEKMNIMRSALNQPIKINFDGAMFHGHSGAIPLGPITKVYEDVENDVPVIRGEAVIWTEYYKDIAEHLKGMFDEGLGTSWEIFYSESAVDESGVEWLHDCIFAGTCIVDTPAYGPNRTRILAIAEKLNEGETTMAVESDNVETPVETPIVPADDNVEAENTGEEVNEPAQAGTEDHEIVYDAQDLLYQLFNSLDALHAELYELERGEAVNNIADVAQSFADRVSGISARIKEMRAAQSELATEVETLKQAEADRKAQAERDERLTSRRSKLAESGIIFDDARWQERQDVIASMDDTSFAIYATDLSSVSKNRVVAEIANPLIPEPLGTNDLPALSEVGAALRKHFSKRG